MTKNFGKTWTYEEDRALAMIAVNADSEDSLETLYRRAAKATNRTLASARTRFRILRGRWSDSPGTINGVDILGDAPGQFAVHIDGMPVGSEHLKSYMGVRAKSKKSLNVMPPSVRPSADVTVSLNGVTVSGAAADIASVLREFAA
jgi:hypothetical protein